MGQAVLTVLGVFIAAVVGPALVSYLTGRRERASKQQDYDRQDAVADRVEKVAVAAAARADAAAGRVETVADQAAEAATLLLAANERVAEATHEASGKLDAIHALVNSQLTAALQAELNATNRELVLLRVLEAQSPSAETAGAIRAAEARVVELKANLADRAKQTATAEAATSG